ncbi:AzlD domain-containing protein [Parahaliea mediterranea]|uniref:AzlD domain-containing protein n=1 Tax=Parahaliea mediterranea TaxID=651086 RepID=A0A939DEV3_9GAMM|nr:AzlD domain-containing protein [Parahaliea mediterranea]MBN7796840.1 AzlD domain-containing protein [Parahaliea mediterranea]
MSALLAIVLSGIGTYFSRAVFILALANRRIPRPFRLAMEYVGPSVMAALVATMLVGPQGQIAAGPAELSALVVAALLAWKTRNHLLTLGGGMAVFWVVRALGAL